MGCTQIISEWLWWLWYECCPTDRGRTVYYAAISNPAFVSDGRRERKASKPDEDDESLERGELTDDDYLVL